MSAAKTPQSIDVTQMAGALAVSLRAWSADALVCSGYKWLSTHGIRRPAGGG